MQTFGVTEEPYLADGQHLNGPAGLFIDASNQLYAVEGNGHRVLRFNASIANSLILGHAGLPWHHDDYLSWPKDVAVDASGNIWVLFSPTIKKFDPSDNPVLTIPATNPWESGDDNYHFNDPWGIAFDSSGRLFVADTGNHRIQVYDVSGETPVYVLTIGITGQPRSDNAGFDQPTRIAFDSSGRLYVMDTANYRVQRCTRNLVPPEAWTCSTFFGVTDNPGNDLSHLAWARGITVRGSDVFIADGDNYRVLKCDLSGSCNHFAGTTGERGWDNSHFWWPDDVAVDSAGNVYVSDWDNHRVQKFNSAGTLIGTIGVTGVPYVTDATHLNTPWGIAVAPDGSIYVTENQGFRLVKMNAAGAQQWTVGQTGVYGSDNAHFGNWWAGPEGNPAIDRAGRIYVPDTSNHRVQIFNSDGSLFGTLGSYGTGQYEFDCPAGVAISPVNGNIFVIDHCNQRVQVFTQDFLYKATIGVLDETGTDNQHFNWPWGVAVDSSGSVYVADTDNHRVQKCTASGTAYTCSTFVGETGVSGDDFGHLHPLSVYVDGVGRVYVADEWNDRIQVFDSTGAYLTTIGGAWNGTNGGMRGPSGVAVDAQGNVYVTDRGNHRIQKFAPGVPGWKQVNINGFGDRTNGNIHTLAPFAGRLYAGTYNDAGNGAQLWRLEANGSWVPLITNGLGITRNIGFNHLITFNGQLYLGVRNDTDGASIYRSSDGDHWTSVVTGGFDSVQKTGVYRFAVFNNQLYAGTSSWTAGRGGEIWRSSSGDAGTWERVVASGFDNPNNYIMRSSEVHNGYLYFGTQNVDTSNYMTTTGGIVIRSSTGDSGSWTKITSDGLGDINNYAISGLASFNGYLYASTSRWSRSGVQVWRCQNCDGSDWEKVVDNGFDNPNNWGVSTLQVFSGELYLVIGNGITGMEVWRTQTGNLGEWIKVSDGGFGDSNNSSPYYNNVTVFNNRLYIGTQNGANSPEVWKKTVTADFSASPTVGAPGTTVTFTNLSGDFTSATWDFGDGSPPVTTNAATVQHTYTAPGTYTVALTVTDGVDTDTMARPSYIQIAHQLFLPLVQRNYNPLLALYDDFNNPAYDGFYNPLKWQFWGDQNYLSVRQIGGALVITNTPNMPAGIGLHLPLAIPMERTLRQLQRFQALTKLSGGSNNTEIALQVSPTEENVNGHGWRANCALKAYGGGNPWLECDIATWGNNQPSSQEFVVSQGGLSFDTWYTIRIEMDPNTAQVCFYLNNGGLGCHIPNDAATLKTIANLVPRLGVWNGLANATGVRYFDDIYITPAGP